MAVVAVTATRRRPPGRACSRRHASALNRSCRRPASEFTQAKPQVTSGVGPFGGPGSGQGGVFWLTPDSYRTGTGSGAQNLSVGTDPLTANSYVYVNGDPINLSDPTGHDARNLGFCRANDIDPATCRALVQQENEADRVKELNSTEFQVPVTYDAPEERSCQGSVCTTPTYTDVFSFTGRELSKNALPEWCSYVEPCARGYWTLLWRLSHGGEDMPSAVFGTDPTGAFAKMGEALQIGQSGLIPGMACLNFLFDRTAGSGVGCLIEAATFGIAAAKIPERILAARAAAAAGEAAVETGDVFVYTSLNAAGDVQYVGITNNIARRAAEHLGSKGISIGEIQGLSLSRADAKAVEQVLIQEYGGAVRSGGRQLMNQINSIATTNSIYTSSIQRGCQILISISYSLNNMCR